MCQEFGVRVLDKVTKLGDEVPTFQLSPVTQFCSGRGSQSEAETCVNAITVKIIYTNHKSCAISQVIINYIYVHI